MQKLVTQENSSNSFPECFFNFPVRPINKLLVKYLSTKQQYHLHLNYHVSTDINCIFYDKISK